MRSQMWWAAGLAGLALGFGLGWMLRYGLERLTRTLGQRLSRLGSSWGYRTRYLSQVAEDCRRVTIRGRSVKAPEAVELERIYVPLHAQATAGEPGSPPSPVLDIGQALAQHQRLVLLGGPGAGKTTLMNYLALTFAQERAGERLAVRETRLPVLIPLRRLVGSLQGTDVHALPAYLTDGQTDLGIAPPKRFFSRALREGRCLVLLDGLDEIVDETERQQAAEWIDRLVTIRPRNRYVVTSRPAAYEATPLQSGFAELNIRDLSMDDSRRFVRNWCLATEIAAQGGDTIAVRQRAQHAAQDLIASIEADADLGDLATNPLLLSTVVLAHRERSRLPRRRADVYGECTDIMIGHWDEAKGLVGHLLPQDSHRVLQGLALTMHQAGQSYISRDDLEVALEGSLPPANGHPVSAATFVNELQERAGLLVETKEKTYAFSHLILQEYLAAKEIVDHRQNLDLLLERVGDRWWSEVATLYSSIAGAEPLVDTLLAGEDDSTCSRLLLAGRCVAQSSTNGQVRQRVIERLEDTLRTQTDGIFITVGQQLAEIAGEDSVGFFLRLARDDPEMRESSLWSVAQLIRKSKGPLAERMAAQLLTYFRGEELRQEAGAALERVWFGGSADELKGCLSATLWGRMQDALPEVMDECLLSIPAGEFWMGDERQKTHLDAFQIGKYAVTNAQYKRFVDATGHPPPAHWRDRDFPPEKALHPVVFVSWFDAEAYAAWANKRLPSEQEWEKAARGPDGREYPWGEWDEGRCNTREAKVRDTTRVGHYSPGGDSPYGCVGMAGDVWEWTQPPLLSVNPVVRGGSWNYLRGVSRCTYRIRENPTSSSAELGFRLAAASA